LPNPSVLVALVTYTTQQSQGNMQPYVAVLNIILFPISITVLQHSKLYSTE